MEDGDVTFVRKIPGRSLWSKSGLRIFKPLVIAEEVCMPLRGGETMGMYQFCKSMEDEASFQGATRR